MLYWKHALCGLAVCVALTLSARIVCASDGWTADAMKAPIPAAHAAGMMHGISFKPRFVYLSRFSKMTNAAAESAEITFATGKEFMLMDAPSGQTVGITFAKYLKVPLDGSTFVGTWAFVDNLPGAIKDNKGGSHSAIQAVQAWYKVAGKSIPNGLDYDIKLPRYSVHLTFGKKSGNSIPGKVYLCFGDKEKSYLIGSFTATLNISFPDKELK